MKIPTKKEDVLYSSQEKKSNMGRPKKEVTRNKYINATFTEMEVEEIALYLQKKGFDSRSTFIRNTVLKTIREDK